VGESKPKLEVSPAQVAGSALAAVTAAVVASHFGVGGTVVGTAVASAVATVGTAVYTQSLRRANARLLTLRLMEGRVRRTGAADPAVQGAADDAPGVATTVALDPPAATEAGRSRVTVRPWTIAVTVVVVFLLAMAVVTSIELVAGRPLSALVGGGQDKAGTSVGRVLGGGGTVTHRPSPAHTPSPRPTATAEPSPTGPPSPSPSPSVPTASPDPSPDPSPTPSPTTTPRPPG
jgi:hypothetical protein